MERLKSLVKYKRIAAAVVILLLVLLTELAANRHALKDGYWKKDLSSLIETVSEDGTESYQLTYQDKQGIYVKSLELQGNFSEERQYRIRAKTVNAFGKTEIMKETDYVNAFFGSFSTNINRQIKSLKITMKKTEGMELTGVTIENRFEFNKYRMALVFLVLLFLYCALFESFFAEKTEWYFAAFALAFGLLLIAAAQTSCNSWDEQIHFAETCRIAGGREVTWSAAAKEIADRTNFQCNTKAEYAQLRAWMDEQGRQIAETETRSSLLIPCQKLAYVPMALFLAIGRLIGMPFSMLFAFGKLGNLLVYIPVMFFAIRLAPVKKQYLFFLAMMPTMLFQAVSYTYDGVVVSFLTLGCVLWCRETYFGGEKCNVRAVSAAAAFMVLGSLSKAIYIPVVLLMLLLPQIAKRSRKEKLIFAAGIGVIFLLVMMTFVFPVITRMAAGEMNFGGDARGGDTSVARQLLSLIKHPLAGVKLFAGEILALDNFRNLGSPESANYFFGNLMLLSYSSLGTLGHKWTLLLLPVLTLLVFHDEPGNKVIAKRRVRDKVFAWGVFLATVLLIWSAMYLSFTPVGSAEIAGVQARYYLPLLYLGGLLAVSTRVRVKLRPAAVSKMVMLSALILQAAAMGELALGAGGRLL